MYIVELFTLNYRDSQFSYMCFFRFAAKSTRCFCREFIVMLSTVIKIKIATEQLCVCVVADMPK